jgi:hypothetical protein
MKGRKEYWYNDEIGRKIRCEMEERRSERKKKEAKQPT